MVRPSPFPLLRGEALLEHPFPGLHGDTRPVVFDVEARILEQEVNANGHVVAADFEGVLRSHLKRERALGTPTMDAKKRSDPSNARVAVQRVA